MMAIRFGNERISMRTSVVFPDPDGPESTQIAPFLERFEVNTSKAECWQLPTK